MKLILELSLANSQKLLEDYAIEHNRPEAKEIIPAKARYYEEHFREYRVNRESPTLQDWVTPLTPGISDFMSKNPQAGSSEDWAQYVWRRIYLPNKYLDKRSRIRRLRKSVFMPNQLSALLTEFEKALDKAEKIFGIVLSESGRTLHNHVQQGRPFEMSNWLWVHNTFNHKLPTDILSKPADNLLTEMRRQFDS